MLHAARKTDGRTDRQLTVVLRKFTDPPKNAAISNMCLCHFNKCVIADRLPTRRRDVLPSYSWRIMEAIGFSELLDNTYESRGVITLIIKA